MAVPNGVPYRLFRTDTSGPLVVTTWQAPATTLRVSEDALLVVPQGLHTLRAAALDGVTPTAATPGAAGVNGAVWASAVLSAALRSHSPALDCLDAANRELHRPGLPGRDQRQATAAVADIRLSCGQLQVHVVRSGDCDVWARSGQVWTQLCPGPMLDPAVRARLTAWRLANPEAEFARTQDIEREWLADPAVWNSTPVGRFETLRVQTMDALVDELVLATDGALLDGDRVGDLDGWLARIRDVEASQVDDGARVKKNDDIAVIRVTPAGPDH